ncbi:MAG TPA: TonB family protein [Pyrinomonadaceae bacterium]|nr:TonB family protein [Pyrinomonadaceae bacterium]
MTARPSSLVLALLVWPACPGAAAPPELARAEATAAGEVARAGATAAETIAARERPATITARERPATVAVLDLGATETGERAAGRLAKLLAGAAGETKVSVLNRGLARAAARGVGYAGSLNLTLVEARDLGAAVGCDFYVTGDAQTVRRSSSERAVYFEAYATLFVVGTRTGRLVRWSRPAVEADAPERAEAALLALLDEEAARLLASVAEARALEAGGTPSRPPADSGVTDGAGDSGDSDDSGGAGEEVLDLTSGESFKGLREPAPFSRLRPAYTDAASRAEAEATVDVVAEIGADGRVRGVRVVRWAGFGLDEEVAATVRRMNFRPATLDGEPRTARVLLRYNFRRPQPAAR